MFLRLDSCKSGHIEVNQIKKYFIDTADSIWSDMINVFHINGAHSSISYPVSLTVLQQYLVLWQLLKQDFENFHLGVSIEASSDADFSSLMRRCWGI